VWLDRASTQVKQLRSSSRQNKHNAEGEKKQGRHAKKQYRKDKRKEWARLK
jgi:hypothetical protein